MLGYSNGEPVDTFAPGDSSATAFSGVRLEQQPCGVQVVERVGLVGSSIRFLMLIGVMKFASYGAEPVVRSLYAT